MTKHVEIRLAACAIAVPQGVTILDAALAEGIAYPHGCPGAGPASRASSAETSTIWITAASR